MLKIKKNYRLLKSNFFYQCLLQWHVLPENCTVLSHGLSFFALFDFVYWINLKNKPCSSVLMVIFFWVIGQLNWLIVKKKKKKRWEAPHLINRRGECCLYLEAQSQQIWNTLQKGKKGGVLWNCIIFWLPNYLNKDTFQRISTLCSRPARQPIHYEKKMAPI